MRVRLLSDLHLELHPIQLKFNKRADICILAGDIGNPTKEHYEHVLNLLSLTHQKVFVITGNHEYYNNDLSIDNHIISVCEDNIHFLQLNSLIYKNVKFMGCTLWSQADQKLSKYMNDFNYIQNFNSNDYQQLHEKHSKWLLDNINDNIKTCVITHHLPSSLLIDEEYKNHPLTSYFATDLDLPIKPDYWCYGHTHKFNYVKMDGCEYHCNPRGYKHECINYNMDYIFTIE